MKRSPIAAPNEASTSFLSTNQFAVLFDSESENEENGAPPQTNTHLTRIPPIVIYSYLNKSLSNPETGKQKINYPG